MPISAYMQTSLVRDANIAMALSFFPRWRGGFWPNVCGSTLSTRDPEPFSLLGAAPLMRRWLGQGNETAINSWSMLAPNFLLKNFERIQRREIELDQTGAVLKRMGAFGVRLAQYPDWLTALAILKGPSETTIVGDDGAKYNATFEPGVPWFSSAHTTYSGANQSNIIQGQLPATKAAYIALDVATQANRMQKDMELILDAIGSVKDDKGAQLYPDLEPEKNLVVLCPPLLKLPATLAFSTLGATIGGSNGTGGSSGGTTNIVPQCVRKVISSPLLAGCEDITLADPGTTVSPANPTDYYVLVVNDYTMPLYYQRFRPKAPSEVFPLGASVEDQVKTALSAAKSAGVTVTPEATDVYAATEILHNLSALGAQAQESVAAKEEFFISGRSRGTVIRGPWFTAWQITASGAS